MKGFRGLSFVFCLLVALFLFCSFLTSPLGIAQQRLPEGGKPPSYSRLSQEGGLVQVMVELSDPPTTRVFARELERARPLPLSIRKAQAVSTAQKELARIDGIQKAVLTQLEGTEIGARPIYRMQRVYNGIVVQVELSKAPRIRSIPGVKAVHPMIPKSLHNAASVPFIGAPFVWASGLGNRGEGIKVGVIDTGIDYLHTNFGGPGSGYESNDTTRVGDTPGFFPGVKVVGGWDFAGDWYDASDPFFSIPQPDPDPMDCHGHGSHVAGTIGGYGVKADGSTFTGPYDDGTPFGSLRIGPGVAPQVELYALRVFGCNGTTNLTEQAIEWAVDPNEDGDFSDHLDVINMSLGSSFGAPYDTTAVASDNAALAGVIVVVSAGNDGDTFYIVGSPGTSGQAITVASSVDSTDTFDGFRINSPAAIEGVYPSSNSSNYDWAAMASPVTGVLVYPSTQSSGCDPFNPTNASLIAGKIVLLDWTDGACGSATRTNNAADAGAIGVILAYNHPTLDIAIAGSSRIPATITTQGTANLLKANLGLGVNVTLSKEYLGSQKVVDPGRADTLSSFSSRGPSRGSMLKPDIAAPGQTIFSTRALSGSLGESMNGTSMAAPHVAGAMALLRKLHPTWTVEELKALIMNTATHDLFVSPNATPPQYAPTRVGAGRIDLQNAAQAQVVAYNSDDSGLVSVSFGSIEVTGVLTLTKTVRVVNKGSSDVTYNIGYTGITSIPGVSFSFPDGTTLSVPGGSSRSFRLQLSTDSASMEHTRDGSLSETQGGYPRHWVSEASGYVTLAPASGLTLRLPVYAAPRAASTMATAETWIKLDPPVGTKTLALTGGGVNTGSSFPTDEVSLVSAFELQESNPKDAPIAFGRLPDTPFHHADLKAIGVASDYKAKGSSISATTIYFGIATHGDWSTPNEVEFDIVIDTDRNGTWDYVLYNTNYGTGDGRDPSDVFISVLCPYSGGGSCYWWYANGISSSVRDTVLFNTNVMVLPVSASRLGLSGSNSRFDYFVVSFSRDVEGWVDVSEVHTYDPANPGFSFTGTSYTGTPVEQPLYKDLDGQTIGVDYDWNHYLASHSRGLLLLHHHNGSGNRAEIVEVGRYLQVHPKDGTQGSELSITGSEFGSQKGKVLLGNAPLKVLAWSNTTIRCLLTKVVPLGTYSITVTPKGLTPVVEAEAYSVRGPILTEILPGEASAGDEVVVRGLYFGSKKGKVLLGNKTCKVKKWSMESATGESEVVFLVPKGLLPATYDLRLLAKTVEAVAKDALRVK